MIGDRKVVGLRREEQMAHINALEEHELLLDTSTEAEFHREPGGLYDQHEYETLGYEEAYIASSPLMTVARAALIIAAVAWIGFAAYLFYQRGFALPALEQVPYIATVISMPLVLAATNNNWSVNIALFAVAYFLGAGCWFFINSEERLHD